MFLITRDVDALDLSNNFVCADCWEALRHDLRTNRVTCVTPSCPCRAAVHIKSVNRREAVNATELADARFALRSASVLPARQTPQLDEAQLLKELGF